ncbi:MAG: hypothetical protein V4480_04015 [Patescibacteria group bacterium]
MAASTTPFNTFITKVEAAIIDPLITVLALAAFILFVWGVIEFIQGAGSPEKRTTGQQHILWGLVGLAILFGARIIVTILTKIVGG